MPEIGYHGVGDLPRQFIGIDAARVALVTTSLPVGSTWIVVDGAGAVTFKYIWDGTAWNKIAATTAAVI